MLFLYKIANWKVILPVFLIFLFFFLFAFPQHFAKMNALANEEVQILDARISYTLEDVNTLFEKLKPEGRAIYKTLSTKTDMAYPLVYGSLLILLLANNLKKISVQTKIAYLSFLPVVGVTFDYLENISIQKLLYAYPNITATQVNMSSLLTSMKWFSLFVCFCLLLLLVSVRLIKKRSV